jgi:hypothetical protein
VLTFDLIGACGRLGRLWLLGRKVGGVGGLLGRRDREWELFYAWVFM